MVLHHMKGEIKMEVTFDPVFMHYLNLRSKVKQIPISKSLLELAQVSDDPDAAKKAFETFKKSAAQGDADAQFMLALCYETGTGVKQSYPNAIKWYIRTDTSVGTYVMEHPTVLDQIENERIDRCMTDPRILAYLDALNAPDEEMYEYELQAAEAGNGKAQNALGHRYFYGQGVPQDYEKAGYWYQKSAEQGCEAGILHWAEYCRMKKNNKEAAQWYRKYAELQIQWRNRRMGWA